MLFRSWCCKLVSTAIVTSFQHHETGEARTESYTGGPLGGLTVETRLDSQLRRDRLWLKQGGNTLATTEYNYQPTSSRLASVTDGQGGYSATYTTLPIRAW